VPFLDYDVEIRTVICSTNAIESLNAGYRRAVKAGGHFPTEQAGSSASTWSPAARPNRERPHQVGDAVEAGAERLRDHLRRPYRPQQRKLALVIHRAGQ
jgi:transposase-like protein